MYVPVGLLVKLVFILYSISPFFLRTRYTSLTSISKASVTFVPSVADVSIKPI